MAYKTNHFCWHGLQTTDPDQVGAFYPEVLGWKVQTMQMGTETSRMFLASDVPLAHFMKPPMPGIPSHWNNYLRVDNVDATLATAIVNGGTQVAPPTDIAPGRFAIVASPSGATFALFREADVATAAHHPGGLGGVHWTELHSQDVAADVAWLKSTFGFETSEMPMPGFAYTMLNQGGQPVGGVMPSQAEGAPSFWLTWFHVADVDAASKRVENHGGTIMMPASDMEGIGRMTVVTDPTGAAFGLITPPAT